MSPDRIIVVADPVTSLPFKIGRRRPGASVNEFFLVRREERFRYGIVVTYSCPAEGPPDIVLRAVLVEHRGSVLAAAAGMNYHPGGRLAVRDGHPEGGGDEAGAHVRGDGPPDYLA